MTVDFHHADLCGVADIQLRFPEHGIVVMPFELDIYENRDEFNYARARLSWEAGELLRNEHDENTPVLIESEGETIFRMYLPEEGIEVNQDDSFIELYDELMVLQEVEVNKSFSGNWNLSDVLDWLLNHFKETYGESIISGWEPTEFSDIDEDVWTAAGRFEPFMLDNVVWNFAAAKSREIFTNTVDADLDYEDVSVWNALVDIANKYQLDIFSKSNGVVHIGSHEDENNLYVAGFAREHLNLTGYSVPSVNNPVGAVFVRGATPKLDEDWSIIGGYDSTVFTEAVAVREDFYREENSEIRTHVVNSTNSGTALEEIAENLIRKTVAQENEGSLTIDVLSLDEEVGKNPKYISLGDIVHVVDHRDQCRRAVGGTYRVNSIHHQLNPRKGWQITVGIYELIPDEVKTDSYHIDLESGEVMEDEKLYTSVQERLKPTEFGEA